MSEREIAERFCNEFHHQWKEEYYGYRCGECGQFIPFGCEPWLNEPDDYDDDDA